MIKSEKTKNTNNRVMNNILKLRWTIIACLALCSILICTISSPFARTQLAASINSAQSKPTPPDDPLDEEALAALVEKLTSALTEIVEDEETQNSITEKWDARMEKIVGKTAKQVVDLLLADVKSVIKDADIVNQLKESFIAASTSESETTTQPEPSATPVTPDPLNSSESLGEYINGLSYNPESLLAVQGTGDQPIFEKALSQGETMRKPGGGTITTCTKTPKQLSRNFDEIAVLQPTRGVIYPGALIFADKYLVNGEPRPMTGLPRFPLNLRLDLPGLGENGKFTIDEPTEDNVQTGVNQALDSWNNSTNFQNGYVNNSRSGYSSAVAYSSEQLPLNLGFNENWAQGSVSAQFKYVSNLEKVVVSVAVKQVFYTVDFNAPATPEGFFDSGVTAEQAHNVFSSAKIPAYISSVNYGRIIMFRMESNGDVIPSEAESALRYAAGLLSVSGEIQTKYNTILSNSVLTAVTVGSNGQAETANVKASDLMPIIKGKNAVYSKSNPGIPISYSVKFLKDNSIAKIGATADYSEEKCETVNNKWIEIRQNGWYVADYTVSWDEPGRPAQKVEGRYVLGNKMHVSFSGDATNIRVNLRTMSGVGILDKVLLPTDLNTSYQIGGHAVGPNWSRECKNQAGQIEWKQNCN